jgi:hypothetical protein
VTTNAELRRRWFATGAAALQRATGGVLAESYACPLCRIVIPAEDQEELSLEDVPPKRLGGRPLVLTCKPCNNTHGSRLDSHAEKIDRFGRLLTGKLRPDEKVPAYIDHEGERVPVDLRHASGGEFLVRMDVDHAPPGAVRGYHASLATDPGHKPKNTRFVTVERVHHKSANLSWARAAYLVAFAVGGYRWAFGTTAELEALRRQFHEPTEDHAVVPMLFDPTAVDDYRHVMLVKQPIVLAGSLVVGIGGRAFVLPGMGTSWTFAQAFQVLGAIGGDVRLTGSEIPWPREARYEMDTAGPPYLRPVFVPN